jgi:hypothetical protein
MVSESVPDKVWSGRNGCGREIAVGDGAVESLNSQNTPVSVFQKIFDISNASWFWTWDLCSQ